MDFISLIIFEIVYFVRPQDWFPGLIGKNIVKPIMAIAILAMFFRPRGFHAGELVRTPADWLMVAYYIYIVVTADQSYETAKAAVPLLAFYIVTRQALFNTERQAMFLYVWTACVCVVAAMAVLSLIGIDLTGAAPVTAAMKGRLVLNTWHHNNPSALGHSVMAGIPLVYFALMWKRPVAWNVGAVPLIVLLCFCVFKTQSKGAYVAGMLVVTTALLLGRPRIFQITIIVLATTFGTILLFSLPRMESLSSGARTDEGILGRLMAWEMARTTARTEPYGEGFQKFVAVIRWEGYDIIKATHGSYVKIGADLGYPGLILFVGILYCGGRVLLTARTRNDEEERIRRMLFSILLAYAASGWMIDRAYHTEFFLLAGAISAFHLLVRRESTVEEVVLVSDDDDDDEDETMEAEEREHDEGRIRGPVSISGLLAATPGQGALISPEDAGWQPRKPDLLATAAPGRVSLFDAMPWKKEDPGKKKKTRTLSAPGIRWRRLGLLDFVLILLLFRVVLGMWDWVLKNL